MVPLVPVLKQGAHAQVYCFEVTAAFRGDCCFFLMLLLFETPSILKDRGNVQARAHKQCTLYPRLSATCTDSQAAVQPLQVLSAA
jgi:hypothetical protein